MTSKQRISEFFSSDVRDFSIYDCVRSIPSGIDGFKPSQRKVIFGMIKKFGHNEVKVNVASAGIMEVSCYHHGDLSGVIVGMAQNYVGANNLNYLEPEGQFGSRISPDAAATRYIFTRLNDNFKKVFPKDDDIILQYMEDDGMSIEPNYYLPVVPNVLINGARGMGTGFACSILCYNPEDLRKQSINYLKKGKTTPLVPWYRGFNGVIEKNGSQTVMYGDLEIVNSTTIKVTEIPIGVYTIDYRKTLNKLEELGVIKGYDDNSTEERVEFIITCPRETTKLPKDELLVKFKLISRESENLTVWGHDGKLKVFENPNQLLEWFIDFRLTKYEERRLKKIELLGDDLERMKERIRFIKFYIAKSKWFSTAKKSELEDVLQDEGFKNVSELMSIRIYNLTSEAIEKLEAEIKEVEVLIETLNNLSAKDIYIKELEEIKL